MVMLEKATLPVGPLPLSHMPVWQDALRLVFLGKTGVGKTTTINALFALNEETDNVRACTRSVTAHLIPKDQHATAKDLIVMDTPGIGESIFADETNFPLIQEAVADATCIVWMFQADTRVYRPDQLGLKKLAGFINPQTKFVFGLNRVDEIGPQNWDFSRNQMSPEQADQVAAMVEDISRKMDPYLSGFDHQIIPFSAKFGMGLSNLQAYIQEVG